MTVRVTNVHVDICQSLPALFPSMTDSNSYLSGNHKATTVNERYGDDHVSQMNRFMRSCVELRSMEMIATSTRWPTCHA